MTGAAVSLRLTTRILCGILCLAAGLYWPLATANTIKRTDSGLCHPPQSSYYDRINTYKEYDSLQECLAAEGRLPKRLQNLRENPEENNSGYQRSKFGHGWMDLDSDGQDSRAEALISQSASPVRFASPENKRVVHGRWISPFTGVVHTDASNLEADHVIPLKFAWTYGADKWTDEERRRFGNDPRNIWIIEASLNQSKGARGIGEWLPPQGRCGYIARFVRLTKIYPLEIPAPKKVQYENLLRQCAQQVQ